MPYTQPNPTPAPPQDIDLDRLIQALVAGVTGLPGQYVRPRWQPEPANLPDFDVNWAAVGVSSQPADPYVYLKQLDQYTVQLERDERVETLLSFYGPLSQTYAGVFRDGVMLDFNRWAIEAAGIKLQALGDTRQLPALFKEKWLKRQDVTATFKRRVVRIYSQASLASAIAGLNNEYYITPIIVNSP